MSVLASSAFETTMRFLNAIVLPPIAVLVLAFCGASEPTCPIHTQHPQLLTTWSKLLDLALVDSDDARSCMEEVSEKAPLEPLRRLARHLLEEWDLPPTDARLKRPVLIWRPEVDFDSLAAEHQMISGPGVMIEGEVAITGTLSHPVVIRSSRNARVDDLCLAAAARALYRPARQADSYVPQEIIIQFYLDPR